MTTSDDVPASPADLPESGQPDTIPADRTLIEDVLLLLFQPDSGTIAGENILFYVLGGAAVAELALTGRAEPRPTGLFSKPIHPIGTVPPADALLAPAWDYLAEKPRGAQTVLAAIGPYLRAPALDRLVERGDLRRESYKSLGFIPSTRYVLNSGRREELLNRVQGTLLGGENPDSRTAAATALLSASGTLPQFHREIPWSGAVYTRGKELEKGDWGAAAASSAVTRTMTAVITGALSAVAVQAPRP